MKIEKLLVDTGSEYTWIDQGYLKELSISRRKKRLSCIMANGETVTRDVGYVILYLDEFETIDEMVFAKPDDLNLLGARTLKGFGAGVDPQKRKLVAAGPIPAAAINF